MGSSAKTVRVMEAAQESRDSSVWFAIFISLLCGSLALTNQSLWIDEANSALKAMQPTLEAWWGAFVSEKGSDLQMPFYMLYLWGWEKIAGHSELALRAANLPWFFLAQYFLYRVTRRSGLDSRPLLFIAAISPFVWYYLDEGRPYLMQYAASCMVICGLGEVHQESSGDGRRAGFALLSLGILFLAGSSLLGAAWSATAILALCYISITEHRLPDRHEVTWAAATFVGLGLLGSYYFWSLLHGARGSAVGNMGLGNLFYAPFELFGFSGLGPGRLQMREARLSSLQPFFLPLALLFMTLLVVLGSAVRMLLAVEIRSKLTIGLIYGLPAAVVMTIFGFVANFRLLGRHFTPLAPLICILLTVGVVRLWKTRSKAIAAAMLLLWLGSSFSLRFAARHRKDDYRDATAEARQAMAANKTVWWSADLAGARYYQLPVGQPNTNPIVVLNPTVEELRQLPRPDVIILSKTDIFDANQATQSYLKGESFQLTRSLPAFTVWQR